MQIITRAEAREQLKPRYFTGKACRYGHLEERFTLDARCLGCSRDHSAKSRAKHLDARRASDREYARDHASNRKEYRREWVSANREKVTSDHRDWCARNPERRREHHKRYHAAKVRATPAWADLAAIEKFYADRPEGMEVDHMVALQGRNVSGLHVHWNLQYLTPYQNAAKGNR
jgi:hypothetical protein